MTAIGAFDLVLALALVSVAAGYMLWKIVLKPRYGRNPAVRVGPILTRSVERARREKRKKRGR